MATPGTATGAAASWCSTPNGRRNGTTEGMRDRGRSERGKRDRGRIEGRKRNHEKHEITRKIQEPILRTEAHGRTTSRNRLETSSGSLASEIACIFRVISCFSWFVFLF